MGNGIRRYDLGTSSGDEFIFYEFKSTGKIPPPDFAKQFFKDLLNEQGPVNWMFDADKVETLNVDDFIAILEKENIPPSVLDRLGLVTKEEFFFWFRNNFNNMFFRK